MALKQMTVCDNCNRPLQREYFKVRGQIKLVKQEVGDLPHNCVGKEQESTPAFIKRNTINAVIEDIFIHGPQFISDVKDKIAMILDAHVVETNDLCESCFKQLTIDRDKKMPRGK